MTAPESTAVATASTWRSVLTGPQGALVVGLVLITLTVATESLIITAIMPVIVHDIGGLQFYGLAFSAFFLAGLASIPTAGWAVDRYGPSTPFAILIGVFLVGSVMAALAPSMPVLVAARVLQGYGAAAQFTISQSTIASAFSASARVKVLSLMSTTWIAPGLVGPALGVLISSAFGWRWAFGAIVAPAVAAGVLTYPRLRSLRPAATARTAPPLREPLQVALGAGLLIGGLTSATWWGVLLVAAGLPIATHALRGLLPAGSLRARPGLPAIAAAGFLLNLAFYGAATFVPLVLTNVRGTSLTTAGIVVSAGTIAWSVSVWLNTQMVDRYPRRWLIAGAGALLAIGILGFGTAIAGLPLPIAYAGWIVAGMGMGIAFNTFTLNVMLFARKGAEGAALAARNLSSSLGTAVGSGIGGAALAVSTAAHAGIRPGLEFIYLLAAAAAVGSAILAGRSSRQ